MKVEQALIAIGGKASRLQGADCYIPIAKSLLTIGGKPLLYWNLESLGLAGIKKIVLAGDRKDYLASAEQIVASISHKFDETYYFQDQGLGVHGLPYHAKHLFQGDFFFECGHGISRPAHYQAMDIAKNKDNVVFSAFRSHPSNPRQPVLLEGSSVSLVANNENTGVALAHPLLIDQAYAKMLPDLDFNIHRIIRHYATAKQLRYVWNDMPPEFDTEQELHYAQTVYPSHLLSLGISE